MTRGWLEVLRGGEGVGGGVGEEAGEGDWGWVGRVKGPYSNLAT